MDYHLMCTDEGFYEQEWELAENNVFIDLRDGEQDSSVIDRDNANEINRYNVWG